MAPRTVTSNRDPYGKLNQFRGGQGPVGRSQLLDEQALQEIKDIELEQQIALAEIAQRRGVASADADFQRRGVQRDIGITEQAGARATELANQSYADLIANLGTIIPQTEQAYANGVAGVQQAYGTGVLQSGGSPTEASSLQSQLAALTGGQVDNFANRVQDPSIDMQALLQRSGQAASQNLQTLGQGDVAAARNALPGYDVERSERVSDIDLDMGAQLSQLRNELAGIHADFVPFNQAELELNSRRAIRQILEESQNRQKTEQEDLRGYRGVQTRGQQLGRNDLSSAFLDMITAANEGSIDPSTGEMVYGDRALSALINNYQSEETKPSWRQIATIGSNRGPRPAGLYSGDGTDLFPWDIHGGQEREYKKILSVPTTSKRDQALAAQRAENDRRLLFELYNIYQGNY